MSYGLEIFNQYGEEIISGETYYKVQEGSGTRLTSKQRNWIVPSISKTDSGLNNTFFIGMEEAAPRRLDPSETPADFWCHHFAHDGYEYKSGTTDTGDFSWRIPKADAGVTDLIFVEIGSEGLMYGGQSIVKNTGYTTGSFGWYFSRRDSSHDYSVLSTTGSSNNLSDYGLNVFDDSGTLIFDSRYQQAAIKDSYVFTQAQAENIFSTGTPLNITLRQSIPNCKVNAPVWANTDVYGTGTNSNFQYGAWLLMRQTSNTNIRIERYTEPNWQWSSSVTTFRYLHDATLIFSE